MYEADVIRINSQSGKGGIGYILETQYNHVLPPKMREVFGYHVKDISDHGHCELKPQEVYEIFLRDFVNLKAPLQLLRVGYREGENCVTAEVKVLWNGAEQTVTASGNGSLDAVSNALHGLLGTDFLLQTYTQHALEDKSSSRAASYVSISNGEKTFWGAGIDSDIVMASVKALISAVNRMLKDR